MTPIFRKTWHGLPVPIQKRPPIIQYAALCLRGKPKKREILLITSSNGRWIIPKGWPDKGLSGAETALSEAWEEAGVVAKKSDVEKIGKYRGIKRFDDGTEHPCKAIVYTIEVRDMRDDYPEAGQRDRKWVRLSDAAKEIDDRDLAKFIAREVI